MYMSVIFLILDIIVKSKLCYIFGGNWRGYIGFFLPYSQEIKNCPVNIQCRVMYMFVLSYTVKYMALGGIIVYKYDVHLS